MCGVGEDAGWGGARLHARIHAKRRTFPYACMNGRGGPHARHDAGEGSGDGCAKEDRGYAALPDWGSKLTPPWPRPRPRRPFLYPPALYASCVQQQQQAEPSPISSPLRPPSAHLDLVACAPCPLPLPLLLPLHTQTGRGRRRRCGPCGGGAARRPCGGRRAGGRVQGPRPGGADRG